MRVAPYARSMTRPVSPSGRTTMEPTWPSAPGITGKSSGATRPLGALAQPPASAAAISSAARWAGNRSARCGNGLVDLDDEFRSAHAHHRGGRADLHRLGRLLDHLAGDGREPPLLERAVGLARVRRRIELELVDREDRVRPDGHKSVVGEVDAGGTVRARS